jgi:hypothetical protein
MPNPFEADPGCYSIDGSRNTDCANTQSLIESAAIDLLFVERGRVAEQRMLARYRRRTFTDPLVERNQQRPL